MKTPDKSELQAIHRDRFEDQLEYRDRVWAALCSNFWQRFVAPDANVLDLGCGYGQFINHIRCGRKWAMDLNPSSRQRLAPDVTFLEQDCAERWELADQSVDLIFTSNFFEHLPDKSTLSRTLAKAHRCLRDGGALIALGPNIKYLPGKYWDFYDHYLPLTEKSLSEGLRMVGFKIDREIAKFLPYTMADGPAYPIGFVRAYLRLPLLWRFFGKQFLVIARKRSN